MLPQAPFRFKSGREWDLRDNPDTVLCPICGSLLKDRNAFVGHCFHKHFEMRKKLTKQFKIKKDFSQEAVTCYECGSLLKNRKNYLAHCTEKHLASRYMLISKT